MKQKHYTAERNVQIVIALLKAHGIKRVIASPGTTNMTFIGSIQNDPWFQIWSSVDERSAAYIACGMAAETGEPVVISCTGATASRNYMPGLTEAYYRKLPVLAITSHRGETQIGHLIDQQIDRRVIPNDIAVEHVTIPMANNSEEERYCEIEANKAILALTLNGGGPVHINMYTKYCPDFSIKRLPTVNPIFRYTTNDELPKLPDGSIGIFIGSHANFTVKQTKAIDNFCASHDAVVFCDHTSGYEGKYKVNFHLVCAQAKYASPLAHVDLLIHLGEVSASYHVNGNTVWRLSPDGALRDTFRNVSKVFMMEEEYFFSQYSTSYTTPATKQLEACQSEYKKMLDLIPELPFGNIWIAKNTISKLPSRAELHMGIFNSYRSWCFFELPKGVLGKCNVGGFGIDGGISSMIGASLAKPEKLFFGVFGDLAFFYDMNVLGNRHVSSNIRILLNNNARGTEFRLTRHPCNIFGDEADPFMAAAGHYGNQSPELVKEYAQALGFKYLSASNKAEYLAVIEEFTDPRPTRYPILLEVFSETLNESIALETIQTLYTDKTEMSKRVISGFARKVIGNKGVDIIKSILQ